ncbi:phospholipase D family protein [Bacteroidota bacterium]
MAKFLEGDNLNSALGNIFEEAEQELILISPYIKLPERFISKLKAKINNYKLKIIIVFGKNEDDMSKSMKQGDFNFFKELPNIQIRYQNNLHAKYYANEKASLLTSMNLHGFSHANNIEVGVLSKRNIIGKLANNVISNVSGEDSFDTEASKYFHNRVIDQSVLLFNKEPDYEDRAIGIGRKYSKTSSIRHDELSEFFANKPKYEKKSVKKNESSFFSQKPKTEAKQKDSIYKKTKEYKDEHKSHSNNGYCIRTGVEIPFNVEKPLCYDAYKSWNIYGDPEYPEKYCHFSGEKSNGETCVGRPILRKNWSKAKEKFNL